MHICLDDGFGGNGRSFLHIVLLALILLAGCKSSDQNGVNVEVGTIKEGVGKALQLSLLQPEIAGKIIEATQSLRDEKIDSLDIQNAIVSVNKEKSIYSYRVERITYVSGVLTSSEPTDLAGDWKESDLSGSIVNVKYQAKTNGVSVQCVSSRMRIDGKQAIIESVKLVSLDDCKR